MSSVISIAVGKCGISIQEQQWLTLLQEQGIDKQGVATPQEFQQKIEPYFYEVKQNIYKPRALFADLEDGQINRLENGSTRQLFEGVPKVYSTNGSYNLYARGMYSVGEELKEEIKNQIAYLLEQCDKVDSFQIQYSICGGTGSGLGNLICQTVGEMNLYDTIKNGLVQYPDIEDVSKLTLEIYNTLLGQFSLYELDICIPFYNSNIENIINDSYNIQKCRNYENINSILSQVHPTFTCGLRYPGSINASSLKICTNIIPFPRMKLMTLTYLPLNYYQQSKRIPLEYTDMITQSLNDKYFLFGQENPSVMASYHLFRGNDIYEEEIESSLQKLYSSKNVKKVYWLPNSYSISYCKVPSYYNSKQLMSIIANRKVYKQLQIYYQRFEQMHRKKAYLHYYLQEGMDELQFSHADSSCLDLISEYQPWGDDYHDYEEPYDESEWMDDNELLEE